jgi:hypothetical protein
MNAILKDCTKYKPKNKYYLVVGNIAYARKPFRRSLDWVVLIAWFLSIAFCLGVLGVSGWAVWRVL